jgi:sugar phosphate isomerase/epimerase
MKDEWRMQLNYFVRPTTITDYEGTYRAIADAGIESIVIAPKVGEVDTCTDEGFSRAKRTLKDCGLTASASHGLFGNGLFLNHPTEDGWDEMVSAHRLAMTRLRELGARTCVLHGGVWIEGYTREFLWDRVHKAIDELLPTAESIGLILALENLNPNCMGDNSRELADFAASYNHPNMRLCFDCGHANRTEGTRKTLTNMAPWVATAHLHDNDRSADQHLTPGFGTIDWDDLAMQLNECDRFVHLEVESFNAEGWGHRKLYDHYTSILNTPRGS